MQIYVRIYTTIHEYKEAFIHSHVLILSLDNRKIIFKLEKNRVASYLYSIVIITK